MLQRGDFVTLDGELAVVVGIGGEPGVPEDRVAVWFGDYRRPETGHLLSDDAMAAARPLEAQRLPMGIYVWTFPAKDCVRITAPPPHR